MSTADNGRTLREEGSLVGRVRAGTKNVSVLFRFETKLHGYKGDYAPGSWPKKSLVDIRAERDHIRVIVADGIDPNAPDRRARSQPFAKKSQIAL